MLCIIVLISSSPSILVQVSLKFQFITDYQKSCQSYSKGTYQPKESTLEMLMYSSTSCLVEHSDEMMT